MSTLEVEYAHDVAVYVFTCDCGEVAVLGPPPHAADADPIRTLMAHQIALHPDCPHRQQPPDVWTETWQQVADAEAELYRLTTVWRGDEGVFARLTQSAGRRCILGCRSGFQLVRTIRQDREPLLRVGLLHADDCPAVPDSNEWVRP